MFRPRTGRIGYRMSIITGAAAPTEWTVADIQARLGDIPPGRIRTYPAPGTATEQDVVEAEARSDRIGELVENGQAHLRCCDCSRSSRSR